MTGTLTVLPQPDPTEQWVSKIRTAWQKTVAAIIETGEVLIEAREALKGERGAWGRLIGDNGQKAQLPFSAATAKKLTAIAEDERIRSHVNVLPATWGALYEITHLPDADFERAVADGTIHPRMERKDVAELRGIERKPTPKPKVDKPAEASRLPIPTSFEEVNRSLGIIGRQWLVLAPLKIESGTLAEIKAIIVTAMALRIYYRGNSEAKRKAYEITLRAIRRGGRLLDEMEKIGARKAARTKTGMRVGRRPGHSLEELGIDRKDSHKWQRIGRLSEKQFQALLRKRDRSRRPKVKKIAPPKPVAPQSEQPTVPENLLQQHNAVPLRLRPKRRRGGIARRPAPAGSSASTAARRSTA